MYIDRRISITQLEHKHPDRADHHQYHEQVGALAKHFLSIAHHRRCGRSGDLLATCFFKKNNGAQNDNNGEQNFGDH